MPKIPVILLAAGASSRMGQSKPLLDWHGETLIEFQIKKLIATGQQVIVVLGSNADQIIPKIEDFDIDVVVNEQWNLGMGASISCGVEFINHYFDDSKGVLICTVDQPLVDTNYLIDMISSVEEGQRQLIVSESDKGWSGVPVLFDQYYFKELIELKADQGAKSIVNKHSKNIQIKKAQKRLIDMDTFELYKQLLSTKII